MKTRLLFPSEISIAADALRRGEPLVFPTETVYGLGAPIFNEKAVKKIFTIKERPADNPLIAHVASIEQALSLYLEPPRAFWTLAERFWPGPLTLVLERHPKVPSLVSAGHPTIAVRMPSHPIALELIRQVDQPLVAPSANISGRPSPTRAQDVAEDLEGKVPFILDGGECLIGIESTVVSLVGPQPFLLRPGSVSQEVLEETLQQKIFLPAPNSPAHAPGMKYRHYAPRAEVKLIFDPKELKGPFILSLDTGPGKRLLSSQTLYAAFREADRLGVECIEIDCTPKLMQDAALMNRLLKAASPF